MAPRRIELRLGEEESAGEVGAAEIGVPQIRSSEIRGPEVSAPEIGANETSASEVGPGEQRLTAADVEQIVQAEVSERLQAAQEFDRTGHAGRAERAPKHTCSSRQHRERPGTAVAPAEPAR